MGDPERLVEAPRNLPPPPAPSSFPPIALIHERSTSAIRTGTISPRVPSAARPEVASAVTDALPALAVAQNATLPAGPSQGGLAPAIAENAAETALSAGMKQARRRLVARLPAPPRGRTRVRFHAEARAVYLAVFLENQPETAQLQALRDKLANDDALEDLKAPWQPLLDDANKRNQTLQLIGGGVRKLRAAFASATYNEEYNVYEGIDMPSCRLGFKRIRDNDPSTLSLPVVIAPVGMLRLEDFEIKCEESHTFALMQRDFPKVRGSPRLRRVLARAYQNAFPNAEVMQVTIRRGWRRKGSLRSLQGTVGVRRQNAFPFDPCMMEEIVLEQQRTGSQWSKTECCQIERSVPIACDVLR